MARTLAQVDAALAALEAWRTATADPALAAGQLAIQRVREDVTTLQAALGDMETFRARVVAAWRVLRTGRIEAIEDADTAPAVPLATPPAPLPAASADALRWIERERAKTGRAQ